MSSFSGRRKARLINVDDDDGNGITNTDKGAADASTSDDSQPKFTPKFTKKPIRQSGLRKTFQPEDLDDPNLNSGSAAGQDDDGPIVVRPKFGSKLKKKAPKSRLSFGGDKLDGEEEDDGTSEAGIKASASAKPASGGLKAKTGLRGLPMRTFNDDDDRPKYSKAYLEELQSSTPTTPRDTPPNQSTDDDPMILDPSELEGAMIVDSPTMPPAAVPKTEILSEAQIQEKKARRARLAQEQGFLSVESDDDEEERKKEKGDTRLKADEENLGEGFDDYVEDGGLSLGKRAVKERKRRDRQKIAEMITAAEGNTSDDSSDSDAARRIAYESAQTRAGMDGLKRPKKDATQDLLQVPQKITPLPNLTECLSRLQTSVASMRQQITTKQAEVTQLEAERDSITRREAEVQTLLDETGKKYQEAMNRTKDAGAQVDRLGVPSHGIAALQVAEGRGLESLGATPSRSMDEDE
ncbi:hypothetical protein VHEMI05056 [[Torrubiella] hemipterigena]|uniref:Nineteen complex-related protein 2 domain-containing protein n=1 Tax=[Torrubiella] hemipterigena TaxID=1531966 RepID=A0A0A1TG58_9HYPO|nr:hypothetical protein VHEMI05056 [[Torrubiella] hemipterigena]